MSGYGNGYGDGDGNGDGNGDSMAESDVDMPLSSPAAAMSELPDALISDALGLFLSARAAEERDA